MLNLMNVMDVVPFPVFAADEDMCYIYENQAAECFLGYGRAEIIGMRLIDLIVYDPRLTLEYFESTRRTGHSSGSVRYRHRDGSTRDADVNAFTHTLSDQTTVLVALVHPLVSLRADVPKVIRASSAYGFSREEMRLLQLIADGFSDEPIAVLLEQTQEQVAQLVKEVLTKMKASSRTEAAVLAIKNGVLL